MILAWVASFTILLGVTKHEVNAGVHDMLIECHAKTYERVKSAEEAGFKVIETQCTWRKDGVK